MSKAWLVQQEYHGTRFQLDDHRYAHDKVIEPHVIILMFCFIVTAIELIDGRCAYQIVRTCSSPIIRNRVIEAPVVAIVEPEATTMTMMGRTVTL